MRLVFRQVENQLHRADDAARVLGDQERTLAACCGCRDPRPEGGGLIKTQWAHEAHRRATLYAIYQEVGERSDLRIRYGGKASDNEAQLGP